MNTKSKVLHLVGAFISLIMFVIGIIFSKEIPLLILVGILGLTFFSFLLFRIFTNLNNNNGNEGKRSI